MRIFLLILKKENRIGVLITMDNGALAALVLDVRSGKKESFDKLYEETCSPVYSKVASIIGHTEGAYDVVQETYIAAFQTLETLQEPEKVLPWLLGIARNQALNHARYEQRRVGPSLDDENYTEEPTSLEERPDEAFEREDTQRFIAEMIEGLKPEQRQVITLFYYEELSVREIAELLGCAEGTVKSRLNYARKSLKTQLEQEEKRTGVRLYSLTPAAILAGLRWLERNTVMPPDAAARIGAEVAKSCGYSGLLGAGGAVEGGAAAGGSAAVAGGISTGTKIVALVLAALVTVGGVAAGIHAARNREQTPEPPAAVETAQTPEPTPMSETQAAAFYDVLRQIVERVGICTSETQGPGLAYAELIDFDHDGTEELYLYYIDHDHSGADDIYFQTGQAVWCLHEQIWSWDGTAAVKAYDRLHFNNGTSAGRGSFGRILYQEDEITYLAEDYMTWVNHSFWTDQAMYRLQNGTLSLDYRNSVCMTDNFELTLGSEKSKAMARYGVSGNDINEDKGADDVHDYYFVYGDLTKDGKTQHVTYEDLQVINALGGIQFVSETDGSDPVSVWREYKRRLEMDGKQLIESAGMGVDLGEDTLRWKCNDVQGIFDSLKKTGASVLSLAEESAAPTAGSDASAFAAFVAQTDFPEARFLLKDLDGDGREELITVHNTAVASRGTEEPVCEIYRINDSGTVERCYASDPYPMVLQFYEVDWNGQTYPAVLQYSYDLYDGELSTFTLISPQTWSPVCTLFRKLLTESPSGESLHEATCVINNEPASESDYLAIAGTARPLVLGTRATREPATDNSLTKTEFLEEYK